MANATHFQRQVLAITQCIYIYIYIYMYQLSNPGTGPQLWLIFTFTHGVGSFRFLIFSRGQLATLRSGPMGATVLLPEELLQRNAPVGLGVMGCGDLEPQRAAFLLVSCVSWNPTEKVQRANASRNHAFQFGNRCFSCFYVHPENGTAVQGPAFAVSSMVNRHDLGERLFPTPVLDVTSKIQRLGGKDEPSKCTILRWTA